MVTIELAEYNELKKTDIDNYKKVLFQLFDIVCNRPDYNIAHMTSESYARNTSNYIRGILHKKGIKVLFDEYSKQASVEFYEKG